MNSVLNFNAQETFGVSADFLLVIMIVVVIILILIMILNSLKMSRLKQSYEHFMRGRNGKSLENTLLKKIDQMDDVITNESRTRKGIKEVLNALDNTFQKMGLVKYDAFNEMGGKLSFSLCLLDRRNDGFIISAMHSREGCYTYIKEIIDGNSIIILTEEEQEALDEALNSNGRR